MDIEMINPSDMEIVEDPQLDPEKDLVDKGIFNVKQEITINNNTIYMYKDILEAKHNLFIDDKDILDIKNDVYFSFNEDIEIETLLEGLIDKENFKYISNTKNILEKNNSRFIVYILSSESNNAVQVANCINDLYQFPSRVLISLSRKDNVNIFNEDRLNNFIEIAAIVESKGGKSFVTINDLLKYINERKDI